MVGLALLKFLHALMLALYLLLLVSEAPVSLLAFSGECSALRHPCPPFSPQGALSVENSARQPHVVMMVV